MIPATSVVAAAFGVSTVPAPMPFLNLGPDPLAGTADMCDIGAATIIAAVGDVHRSPSRGHFAAFNGTAPIDASSGDIHRHRLSRRGNPRLNAVLPIAAVSQIRWDTAGRAYYRRKLAEHRTTSEARRALERQLSNVVYRQLLVDARARGGPRRTNGNGTRVRVTG